MEFHEAKAALRQGYLDAGLVVVAEQVDHLLLRYGDRDFIVTAEDIQGYADTALMRAAIEVQPVPCSLVGLDYREQVVQPLDPIRWRHLPPIEMGFTFGDPDGDQPYAVIGQPSTRFVNAFRFVPAYLKICLERMEHAPESEEPIDMRRALYKPPTVQVYRLGQKKITAALDESSQLIAYCLFELAYMKGIPVGLADDWPALRRLEADGFVYHAYIEGDEMPMPAAQFDADVVQFYQLGVSSRAPVLQFWAFYQVLEHFFVQVADETLHHQMTLRLNDPRFRPTSTQLDRLIQDVIDHVNDTGSVSMLERVLDKYVDDVALIDFIQQYEDYLGEPLYTRRRRVFGEDVEVKLATGAVIEGVARTIWAIRATLIHSPERASRTARRLPFPKITEMVKPEIPLMKFLAERVIIGSAE